MINNRDIIAAFVLAIAMPLAIWTGASSIIRMLFAIPLVLFLTGHLALRAIQLPLSPIEHAAASIGMSIAICLFGSFVLYAISMLTETGWALWTVIVVGGFSVWVIRRDVPGALVLRLPDLSRGQIATLAVAVLITVGSYMLAIFDEANHHEFRYTNFWMIPTTAGKFIIGIRNEEGVPSKYHVSIVARDTNKDFLVSDAKVTRPARANRPDDKDSTWENPDWANPAWANPAWKKPRSKRDDEGVPKDTLVAEIHSINLAPGQVWTRQFDSMYKTDAILYRGDDPVVYRRVGPVYPNGIVVHEEPKESVRN